MAKPIGTSKLRVRQVPNGEWGVWRLNDNKIPYLLLTFPTIDEAIEIGKKLGKKLNLSCQIIRSEIY